MSLPSSTYVLPLELPSVGISLRSSDGVGLDMFV